MYPLAILSSRFFTQRQSKKEEKMPNIELHGFGNKAEKIRGCIFILLEKKAPTVNIDDVVVTIVPSNVQNREGELRPYVRVASTNIADRTKVAHLIKKYIELDVEWLYLDGFFEGKH